jgi:hypothetical protein
MTLSAVESQHTEIDSWVNVIRPITTLAAQICDTDFVPKALRGNAPAVAAVMLHGRELGLGPMTALALTNMVEGRPSLSAEGQRALVVAAGHSIEFTEISDGSVTVRGRRAGDERWFSVTWTTDRARRANLAGRATYRSYPRAMLAARASAELCRLLFADVLHGTAATEELDAPEDESPATAPATRTRPVRRLAAPALPSPPERDPEPVERRTEPEPIAPPEPEEWTPDAGVGAPPADPGTGAPEHATQPAPDDAVGDADTEPEPEPATIPLRPEAVSGAQLRMLRALWSPYGVTDTQRHTLTGIMAGRDIEGATANLTKAEANTVIDQLVKIRTLSGNEPTREDLRATLDTALGGHYLSEGDPP